MQNTIKNKYAKTKDRSGHVKHKLAVEAVKEQEKKNEIQEELRDHGKP